MLEVLFIYKKERLVTGILLLMPLILSLSAPCLGHNQADVC